MAGNVEMRSLRKPAGIMLDSLVRVSNRMLMREPAVSRPFSEENRQSAPLDPADLDPDCVSTLGDARRPVSDRMLNRTRRRRIGGFPREIDDQRLSCPDFDSNCVKIVH